MNCHANCTRNGVVHLDKFHTHTAHLDGSSRLHFTELYRIGKSMFFQLALNQSQRQLCSIDRNIDFLQEIRQTANVVFMSVRQHDATHLVPICFYIGEIRNDNINARHITVWKRQTAVQNEHIVAAFKHGHILSDFVQAAQRNNPNRCPANFLLMIRAALCSGKRCCTGHCLGTTSCLLCWLFATVLLWRSPPIISLLRQCCCLSFFSFFRSQIKNLSFCSQMRQKVILHKDAQFPFCCVIVCAISITGYIRYK